MTKRPHIVDGKFQSDKYPTCPPGKVPLSVADPTAQDLLWQYAQRRRAVDAEFADDLEFSLRYAGYAPTSGAMRRVILESPFAGATPELAARNARYLDAAMRDCLNRGESPYASHRMLTSALDDTKPEERELGIAAGFAWREAAAATVVYVDLGVSRGMGYGIVNAAKLAREQHRRGEVEHTIEFRWLRGEWRP